MEPGFYFMQKRNKNGQPEGGWYLASVRPDQNPGGGWTLNIHFTTHVGRGANKGAFAIDSAIPVEAPGEWGDEL